MAQVHHSCGVDKWVSRVRQVPQDGWVNGGGSARTAG